VDLKAKGSCIGDGYGQQTVRAGVGTDVDEREWVREFPVVQVE
jgi:hypothetical protein